MRISELSRRSGVTTSTIKFYIRDGLLPAGTRSQRNQADYGENHLQRLDLIKALREVADLPLDVVRAVLEQFDKPWDESDPIGPATQAIYRVPDRDRNATEEAEFQTVRAEVEALVRGREWVLPDLLSGDHYLNIEQIADAVMQMRRYLEPEFAVDNLAGYARAAWIFSEAVYISFEDRVPQRGDDLVDPTRLAILGTLLIEPLVMAFVRTALVMRSRHITEGVPLPATGVESTA